MVSIQVISECLKDYSNWLVLRDWVPQANYIKQAEL